MPPLTHLLVEICAFVFAAGSVWEAARSGKRHLATVITAMGFGLLVEVHFVTTYAGYAYGDFLVEVALGGRTVPLWVGAGWGTILYTAMRATDRMELPWAVRPALDALLAVSLDLTVEPAARMLGWWTFARPGQLFGVPLENFIGWMLIAGTFSLVVRAGFLQFQPKTLLTSLAVPAAALFIASVFIALLQLGWEALVFPYGGEVPFFLGLVALLAAVSLPAALRVTANGPRPWLLTAVPVGFHGLCIGLLLLSGDLAAAPHLAVVLPGLAAVSIAGFRYPGVR